jgi:hypothetical protein
MGLEGRRIDDDTVVFGKPLSEKALSALKRRSPTADSIIKSLPKSAFIPIDEREFHVVEEPEEVEVVDHAALRKAEKRKRFKQQEEEKEIMNLEEELEMLEQEVTEKEKIVEEVFEETSPPQMKDQILELLELDPEAPSQETINAWKSKYGNNGIHVMAFGEGDVYIYHHLTRGEWKKIKDIMGRLKSSGSESDEVEEKLKEKVVLYCTLYPKVDDQWLEYCKAGVIDSLYQMILLNSGFLTPQQAMLLTTQL